MGEFFSWFNLEMCVCIAVASVRVEAGVIAEIPLRHGHVENETTQASTYQV